LGPRRPRDDHYLYICDFVCEARQRPNFTSGQLSILDDRQLSDLSDGEPILVPLSCSSLISKKIILRPISHRSPCAPDVPGAYNLNSSSVCVRPGSFRPEVKGPPPMRPDATGSVWMHWTRPFCIPTPYNPQKPSLQRPASSSLRA